MGWRRGGKSLCRHSKGSAWPYAFEAAEAGAGEIRIGMDTMAVKGLNVEEWSRLLNQ